MISGTERGVFYIECNETYKPVIVHSTKCLIDLPSSSKANPQQRPQLRHAPIAVRRQAGLTVARRRKSFNLCEG